MASSRILILLFGMYAAVLAGCQSTDPVTPGPDRVAAEEYPQVVLDPELEEKLVRTAPEVIPPEFGQPLKIRVPIRSVSQKRLYLQYRVLFFDSHKKQLNDYPVWKELVIMPRARHVISANAISTAATDWVIEIKPL